MFFSLFWTAYLPLTLIFLSLVWQSLVDFFRRKRVRAQIVCDPAKFMSECRSRDPRPMLVDNWR
jgi:hypothetical protein